MLLYVFVHVSFTLWLIGCFKKGIRLIWNSEKVSWADARDHCSSQGLRLFDLINGDLEVGLLERYGDYIDISVYRPIWVGVRKLSGVWTSLSGKNVQNLISWNENEPDNRAGEIYLFFDVRAYQQSSDSYAHDALLSSRASFFCYNYN